MDYHPPPPSFPLPLLYFCDVFQSVNRYHRRSHARPLEAQRLYRFKLREHRSTSATSRTRGGTLLDVGLDTALAGSLRKASIDPALPIRLQLRFDVTLRL